MTFKRSAKIITFPEDHELHGLEVVTRRPRIEHIEAVDGLEGDETKVKELLNTIIDEVFGPMLIAWNYVDEMDERVPATAAGFRSIDIEAQMAILAGWTGDMRGVEPDLGKGSDSGHSSPARLLDGAPTVTTPALSNALQSLHGLNASTPS